MAHLSVIIPAYNEAENIIGALEDVFRDVAPVVPDLEVIVVNDGSRDDTATLAGKFAAAEPRVRVVTQPNQGHGPALSNGLGMATGEWVLLLDSDRQASLEDFAAHWALTRQYDVILGLRRPRSDPFYRQIISFFMRVLLLAALGQNVKDGGAPYKLLRRAVWNEARSAMRPNCWIPSVLLAAAALERDGLKVIQLPIRHRARDHGPSTLNLKRLGAFCREGVSDILFYRAHSRKPAPAPVAND
ncbi:glycosyltransferase family 2 protein [Devosia sp. A16]|uniref:glycosyltransferase family 2 protein n=1 Tax=Devosia sp. A16 TaxID=1736675 RepID=UPI0006D7B7E2|nr:glycosyltransferase family 2 protein [Devosia sp. A16]